jgi:hypothetical protein
VVTYDGNSNVGMWFFREALRLDSSPLFVSTGAYETDAVVRGQAALVACTHASAPLIRATRDAGSTWVSISLASSGRAKYLIDQFAACGGNDVLVGADPTVLTTHAQGSAVYSVARSPDRWVTVGTNLRSGAALGAMTQRAPSPAPAGAWAEVEYAAGVFIAVTLAGWIYRSTDGDTWTRMHQMATGARRGAIAHDGTNWLVCSTTTGATSAARSADGGVTWSVVAGPSTPVTTMASALSSSDFGVISALQQLTFDGGLTWVGRGNTISGDGAPTRILRGAVEVMRVGAGGGTVNTTIGHSLVTAGVPGARPAPPELAKLLAMPSPMRWAGGSGGTVYSPAIPVAGASVFGPSGYGSGAVGAYIGSSYFPVSAGAEAVVRMPFPVAPGETLTFWIGQAGGAQRSAPPGVDGAVIIEWRDG